MHETRSSILTVSQDLPAFGSKAWADQLLKMGIASIRDLKRVPGSRLQEYVYQSRLLEEQGFSWHAMCLRAWAHRYWWSLRPRLDEADSLEERGDSKQVMQKDGSQGGDLLQEGP